MISLGQKIKSKESENLQTFLQDLKKKQEILKWKHSEDLCRKAKLNNMKIKVTKLLESERFQVDLKKKNTILRKNQEPEKMENQLVRCTKCDSIFYYQTVCYCSRPMSCKKTENSHSENLTVGEAITGMVPTHEKMKLRTNTSENPHLQTLDDFCDDAIQLNHFFDDWSIEILSNRITI